MRNDYIKGLGFEKSHPFRERADKLIEEFDTETTKEHGVIRWKSNGAIPPKDILEFWKHIGKEFDYELCIETQDKENAEFLKQYREREANRKPSQEEMFEMEAAFGKGATVVNAITGRKIQL